MATLVPPFGSSFVDLAPAEKICIASRGQVGYAFKPLTSDQLLDSINPVAVPSANDSEYVSGAFADGAKVLVQNMGPYNAYVEKGTAPLSKDFRRETGREGDSAALNANGTLTTAMILSGSITSTTASAVTATLETGAVMDASTSWDIGESYEWSVTNTGGNNFVVTAAASGHTVVGSGTVAGGAAAPFRTTKTAAGTFVTKRI